MSLAGELSPKSISYLLNSQIFVNQYVTVLEARILLIGDSGRNGRQLFHKIISGDSGRRIYQLLLKILRYLCTGTNLSQFLRLLVAYLEWEDFLIYFKVLEKL